MNIIVLHQKLQDYDYIYYIYYILSYVYVCERVYVCEWPKAVGCSEAKQTTNG